MAYKQFYYKFLYRNEVLHKHAIKIVLHFFKTAFLDLQGTRIWGLREEQQGKRHENVELWFIWNGRERFVKYFTYNTK